MLYAINNYLKFIMQLYFRPATVKMLSNLKVLTIAMLLKLIMRRVFTTTQWEALLLLILGITVNQLSCGGGAPVGSAPPADPLSSLAMLYTVASVTIPSLASVYNEFALKKNFDTSVHLQNFFMYMYGALFNLVGLLVMLVYRGGEGVSVGRPR